MNRQYRIAYSLLGPIFRMFCVRLRLIEQFKPGCPLLFLSRGGIRIRHFYSLYLSANNLSGISPASDFYISRMAAFRCLLATISEDAARGVALEYAAYSTEEALGYFLPNDVYARWKLEFEKDNTGHLTTQLNDTWLLQHLSADLGSSRLLMAHFREQNALLKEHFAALTASQSEVLLVDTGWSGSMVNVLKQIFPEVSFTACFFGRYNYGEAHPPWFDSMTGLIMQHDRYQWQFPQSSFVFHRHLIEHLCEPRWPSVEHYVREGENIRPSHGEIPSEVCIPSEDEILAKGVADFISQNPVNSITEAAKDYNRAMKRLARKLCFPGRPTALALGTVSRSADFGRDLMVPVLIAPQRSNGKSDHIKKALWQSGQAAIEFYFLRIPVQALIVGRNSFAGISVRIRNRIKRFFGKKSRHE